MTSEHDAARDSYEATHDHTAEPSEDQKKSGDQWRDITLRETEQTEPSRRNDEA
jgi:hypothetical protein